MIKCNKIRSYIESGRYDNTFSVLYPLSEIKICRKRYLELLDAFENKFGNMSVIIVSAPGRTEIGGNHTDHQHGNVLAAAIDLDIVCVAALNGTNVIQIQSEGHPLDEIDLKDLFVRESEKGTSAALIRGMAKWFSDHGSEPKGFNAYTASNVLVGSGLSSSAAFEVAVGNIMASLFGSQVTAVDIAIAGQYAENFYLGKPSGLMDQMASSIGGFVQIDFREPKKPIIRPITCNLSDYGYHLCIVDTKGSHANLTDDYAEITKEMRMVANYMGKDYLRDVDEADFYDKLHSIRIHAGDRAALRAIHFYRDDKLAVDSANALESGNIEKFISNIIRSGRSSLTCLQNVFSVKEPDQQGLTLALDLSETLLVGKGAWRVHGGGFAGTIQAFVPDEFLEEFYDRQNALFGSDSCHILSIRPVGGCEIKTDIDGGIY